MLFNDLAQSLFLLSEESSRLGMTKELAMLLKRATAHEAYHISYLSLGYLKAPYMSDNQFHIAQKTIEKIVADILAISIHNLRQEIYRVGDIGLAILSFSWPTKNQESLTIEQVYEQLTYLQTISGIGSQEERARYVKQLLEKVDGLSAVFIIRIILGTMRLGFSEMTFIDALSWMLIGNKLLRKQIEHAYNITADLGRITYHIKSEGIEALDHITIQLGVPIRPASAERLATAQDIINKIGPCVAQPKLDGFRVQIHVDKCTKVKSWFFSRNLQDMSHMFPEIQQAIIDLPVESVILEGEAIVYDENAGKFLPFQQTVKRKRKHNIADIAREYPLRFYVFDILYLNGTSLLTVSHEERRAILVSLFSTFSSNVLFLIDEQFCATGSQLETYFTKQVDNGLEGIVAKKPTSIYKPGKRDFNWIKLKRQQIGQLGDTIDAVVLGYYHGRGKRAGFGIGAFLAGIYNKEKDTFETLAKVGTGLSDAAWQDLKKQCDYYQVAEQPTNVICSPDLAPDIWVIPHIVAVLLADEITKSPLHTAGKSVYDAKHEGYALRFPRFQGYAIDKEPEQATTTQEIKRLFSIQFQVKTSKI